MISHPEPDPCSLTRSPVCVCGFLDGERSVLASSEGAPQEGLVSCVEHVFDLRPVGRVAHYDKTARPRLPCTLESRRELDVNVAAVRQFAGLQLALDQTA